MKILSKGMLSSKMVDGDIFMKLKKWQLSYIVGLIIVLSLLALDFIGIHLPHYPLAAAELIGGVLLIAGSCEAFVLSVEGISENMHLTDYVAGIYASIASTIPELAVITFLILDGNYQLAWVLALATIFMNSMVFALYSLVLPKDETGNYRLPDAIMWVGSDLLSMGAVISLSVGLGMLLMHEFSFGTQTIDRVELLVFGSCLLCVFLAYLHNITKYYGKKLPGQEPPEFDEEHHPHLSKRAVLIFLLFASIGALFGGEALSNFANFATSEEALNLSFIHAALLLVIFSGTPEYIIVASTHVKDKFDIALSNAFGGIVQVFFVVFGFTVLVIGIVGGSIPIQLATVLLLFFAFPSMFILRVMIADDSKVNALESIAMLSVFVMMLYILIFFGVPP
jgi:Ca2+/Na+ antiporter